MIIKFYLLNTRGKQLLGKYWRVYRGILCRLYRNFELVGYTTSHSPSACVNVFMCVAGRIFGLLKYLFKKKHFQTILISAVRDGTNFYYRISFQHQVVTRNIKKNTLLYHLPPTTVQFREPTVKNSLIISL